MRILLDEQLPRRLARHLSGHLARTVQQCGWSGRRNGDLLRRAAADSFDIFLTADQNLSYQQNFSGLSLAIVVLMAPSNALEDPASPGSRITGAHCECRTRQALPGWHPLADQRSWNTSFASRAAVIAVGQPE
ncbi:MAG: DUF5615 family PIN-like protein [Alphaproteobacteria bacterium]|nr:DUF5615 family PIN-like protein [Alphaproteobacteria bacterium]